MPSAVTSGDFTGFLNMRELISCEKSVAPAIANATTSASAFLIDVFIIMRLVKTPGTIMSVTCQCGPGVFILFYFIKLISRT